MSERYGRKLRSAREAARMSQSEVARAVGITENAYRAWEHGREPSRAPTGMWP
ncbi:MAG: helix-turn-helix transcriptional regulator [Actinomycetota bacterium]